MTARATSAVVVARPSAPTTQDAIGRCSTTRWCDSGDSSIISPARFRRNAKRDRRIGVAAASFGCSNRAFWVTGGVA